MSKRIREVLTHVELDDAVPTRRYPEFYRGARRLVTLPGLHTTYVPQGMCWLGGSLAAVAFYDHNGSASRLAVMDVNRREKVREVILQDVSGEPWCRHAGGLALHRRKLWVCSRWEALRYDLEAILGADERVVSARAEYAFSPDAKCSYMCSDGDMLWFGDFAHERDSEWPPVPGHECPEAEGGSVAWVAAYDLTRSHTPTSRVVYSRGKRQVRRPDRVLFVRKRVQGIAFAGGGRIALSRSLGKRDSKLEFYDPPARTRSFAVALPGGSVEGEVLEKEHRSARIAMPAGSGDLDWNDESSRLIVGFECAFAKYRPRWEANGAGIDSGLYAVDVASSVGRNVP